METSFDLLFLPDPNQNLTYTRSAHLLRQAYRNLRCSRNHPHIASKTDSHVFCVNDYISDHEIFSFISGKRIWAKGPNYASSLEDTGYFFLCGRNIFYTFPQLEEMWRDCCLTLDTEIRETLPSTAYIPNVGSFSYRP